MQQVFHIPLLHPTQTNWHIGTSYYTDSPNTEKFANTANTCQEISTFFRHDMYLYEVTHSELTTHALQAWCCESLGTILILPYMNTPTAGLWRPLQCKDDVLSVYHYDDVIMSTITSQITSLMIVYSTVYSGADQSKHQSSASLAFVWGIHRGPVNSPHKWPVTRKMFPFDDVIMISVYHDRLIFKKWILCLKRLFTGIGISKFIENFGLIKTVKQICEVYIFQKVR